MMPIPTSSMLHRLGATEANAKLYEVPLQRALTYFGVTTSRRLQFALAQILHESGRLYYSKELWGPTTAQKTYERDFNQPWQRLLNGKRFRNTKPFDLGNSQKGDGFRYRGRGLLQLTGRANYAMARDYLRAHGRADVPDFEQYPDLVATPEWAAWTAIAFWDRNGLNRVADGGDFAELTKRINGGYTNYNDRLALLKKAQQVLV